MKIYILKQTFYTLFTLSVTGVLFLQNIRIHNPGNLKTTIAQLHFLKKDLADGAAERMQNIFPEGYVFTWALYGLSSAQVSIQLNHSDPERIYYLEETKRAVEHVRSAQGKAVFNKNLDPPFGAFYFSWSLYLLAEYIRAAGPDEISAELVSSFKDECLRFSEALNRSKTPFLSSYPYASWPADTAVGIAALGIHDKIFPPKYKKTVNDWVTKAKSLLHHDLPALSHSADPATGEPAGGVRGESLALMSRVLIDADPQFALEQYTLLRQYFVDYNWGIPGVREYMPGVSGGGDIDSGPVILGYSGPAVVVGAAAARVHGDKDLANVLLGVVEFAGLPIQAGSSRMYAAGQLPVGDAFIAWALSSPLLPKSGTDSWETLMPWWWSIPVHAASLILAVLVLLRYRKLIILTAKKYRAGV